ncbi:autophagy protein 5 [Tetranychus urticae]|uniref:Autophagy protein 5 n=1 Tax=Tetranychus urticae TaxID=32264 RepID=T1KG00_TETUR|nr:autophagy protein 5 [Tetranychus urticae]
MTEDKELLREIWFAKIPVCFHLASEEIVNFQKPDPYYLMCPRITYFPLVLDKVVKYFSRFVDSSKQQGIDIWIEYEGNPVKWHYPIGLSWDLICDEASLPWNLIIHFDNFPDDELVRCNSRALVQSMFMSTIKEADALKHRSQIISAMQKKEHNQLWHGLQEEKFEQFWAVNVKLMEHTNNEPFRCIPFRFYQLNQPYIQRLFKPLSENGTPNTLGDLVRQVFPSSIEDDNEKLTVLTHGIQPPFETPIHWMSEHLSYPDNFLHLCVFPRKSCSGTNQKSS